MSAVYGIVKNHDGWITVESKKEKGTTVTAAFPAIRLDLEKQHSAGIMQ